MILYCATSNAHKLSEFQLAAAKLAPGSFSIEPLPDLAEVAVPEETGDTFEANAMLKALYYSGFTSEAVFADDSGLAVDALDGAPGVYSARYAGVDGDSRANNALLLERMAGVENRAAHFVCVIVIAKQGQVLGSFRGTVDGLLLTGERGTNGFGYDPLFYYPPFGATFAEATAEQKLSASHRGLAFIRMLEQLIKST